MLQARDDLQNKTLFVFEIFFKFMSIKFWRLQKYSFTWMDIVSLARRSNIEAKAGRNYTLITVQSIDVLL